MNGNFLNGHSPDDGLVKLAVEDMRKSGLLPKTLEKAGVRIFSGRMIFNLQTVSAGVNSFVIASSVYRFIIEPYSR